MLHSTAQDLPDPSGKLSSLLETWDGTVNPLGSGSDYTVFLHHLGIASADMSFSGDDKCGVYHSIYDSFHWMETFGDPEYKLHQSMAKLWGLTALRLSDSGTLSFNYSDYSNQ